MLVYMCVPTYFYYRVHQKKLAKRPGKLIKLKAHPWRHLFDLNPFISPAELGNTIITSNVIW